MLGKKGRNKAEILNGQGIVYLEGIGEGLCVVLDREDFLPVLLAGKWRYEAGKHMAIYWEEGKSVRMGRFIYRRLWKIPAGAYVCYKDGNGLNCQRENLELRNYGQLI